MADETTPGSKSSSVNDTINAVAALAQAVPIYPDAIQPAAKELGKSLEVVAKVVGIALAPLKGVIWGYERIENFITEGVSKRLKDVAEEDIITPAANVVGPAVEALKFTGEDDILRELSSNLIANAMDRNTSRNAHPSFVEIIKVLSRDEALMLHYLSTTTGSHPILDVAIYDRSNALKNEFFIHYNFIAKQAGVEVYEDDLLIASYIENLCRLGLYEIPVNRKLADEGVYDEIEAAFQYRINEIRADFENKKAVSFRRRCLITTNFGNLFINSVVKEKVVYFDEEETGK